MINRRRAIRLPLAALSGVWLPQAARSQQSFQRFIPFLIDLPDWKANKPDGMAMETAGGSMIMATRRYERGEARLSAQVLTGAAAQGALAVTSGIETGDMHMSTSTIDGVQVTGTFTISNNSGTVVVPLGASAMFRVSFNGVAEDDGLALARKFDWKAMQAQVK
jgi:hypothetical protein